MESVQIGDATLYLGDCLEVMATVSMPPLAVVLADPPYSINTKSDGLGKLNPWADLVNSAFWYREWISLVRGRLHPDGCLWSFLNWRSLPVFQKASCDIGWPIESLLVWDKQWIGPGGPRGLRPSYELVTLWCGAEFSISDRGLPDIKRCQWSSVKPNGHPAEKPLELVRWLIDISGGGIVFDPFMGSGTTGEAALSLGRKFIGVEMDSHWFDVACRRIELATSQEEMFSDHAKLAD